MSHTIGNVIYGFPVILPELADENEPDYQKRYLTETLERKAKEAGLTHLYSANGIDPWYCGLELLKFDAVENNSLKLPDLLKRAEALVDGKLKLVVNDMIRQLPKKYQKVKPEIWIVWSSS